ncbi:hypothetical protein SAMN05421594_2638 [Chryseobacterium oleae]|uniref:Uncharacterized protein n=1 Tax=Chryseobacterium oleae TaxID=491207 RepID=A0A1I4YRW1_CHROL|nr:hypothetical protein [Chryseobacterium oleae]SFN40751.1 hypothetical protein SAMN05421594_2638 [Chryseobacterium oleae]
MNQKLFVVECIMLSYAVFGQVGINTATPSAALDVVSKGSNILSKAVEINNASGSEMMTVLDNGNVGINTALPLSKLQVNSNFPGSAFRMIDGTQGQGKYLVSDNLGGARWTNVHVANPIAFGELNPNLVGISSNTLIGHKITLTQGKWMVYVGELLLSNKSADDSGNKWVRLTLSSSNSSIVSTGYNYLASRLVSGWLAPATTAVYAGGYSFLNGVIPVDVTSASVTLYLWTEVVDSVGFSPPNVQVGNNGENYLFAVPSS